MNIISITPGEHYGYRKSRQLGAPLQHIEVIAKAKPGIWKVKFHEGPIAGLSEYVRSGTIIISWSETEAFIQLGLLKVIQDSDAQGNDQHDDTVANAINDVLNATGDWDSCLNTYGDRIGQVPLEAARRILTRARLDPDPFKLESVSYVDRHNCREAA